MNNPDQNAPIAFGGEKDYLSEDATLLSDIVAAVERVGRIVELLTKEFSPSQFRRNAATYRRQPQA